MQTLSAMHSGICSLGQHVYKACTSRCIISKYRIQLRLVVGHIQICTNHAMYKICATGFVLHGGGERLARASILSKLYVLAFLPASSNHSVIIKSSSSSTRVLGARRPTKNRETRHLGARRPTQAQSTLRPQALGARRPTKRTEVLQLGSTSATQAQR